MQGTNRRGVPFVSLTNGRNWKITSFGFFFKEIENHLDKDTEGYDVVLDAIHTMQRVAWHINDMKRKHEHAVRLQVSSQMRRPGCGRGARVCSISESDRKAA